MRVNNVKENEKTLICLLSRVDLTDDNRNLVSEILKRDLDWQYIFNVTVKNKIHLLIFKHLQCFDIKDKQYTKFANIMNDLIYANSIKNELKYQELN